MNSKSFIIASFFFFGLLPVLALAADTLIYKPLVGIPGIGDASSFGSYINALYGLSIAVAALMAVIKIIIAGVKYMLSDVVTSKQEAIGDIKGSLLGLLVVISAVLILTIINPQLTKTEIFIDKIKSTSNTPGVATAIPANIPGRAAINGSSAGYYYRPVHPDPGFKKTCEATAGQIHRVVSKYDVCYEALPAGVEDNLFKIFKSTAFNMTVIFERYQEAHRPRMITSASALTNIAVTEKSKNKNDTDVFLAVELKDRSGENPPIAMDWIDQANKSSISYTCAEFQKALSLGGTVPVRIQTVGSESKGYLACVRMP
jgi:hypothetical protein